MPRPWLSSFPLRAVRGAGGPESQASPLPVSRFWEVLALSPAKSGPSPCPASATPGARESP